MASFLFFFFFSSRRRHTRCALVTGVQTCALPILLLADIHMPEMDGFALARQIRAGEAAGSQQRRLAIIAATADVAPTILQRCTAAGIDRKSTRLNSSH